MILGHHELYFVIIVVCLESFPWPPTPLWNPINQFRWVILKELNMQRCVWSLDPNVTQHVDDGSLSATADWPLTVWCCCTFMGRLWSSTIRCFVSGHRASFVLVDSWPTTPIKVKHGRQSSGYWNDTLSRLAGEQFHVATPDKCVFISEKVLSKWVGREVTLRKWEKSLHFKQQEMEGEVFYLGSRLVNTGKVWVII